MTGAQLIRWDAPGPYQVAFSTRLGGVSEGPFASLNLSHGPRWWTAHDAPGRVEENRRRLCAAIGADGARLALNRQIHSPAVHRARAGARGEPGDGLWTDEAGLPILALGADCVLIALARANGLSPAVGVLHAGRAGILDGVIEAGVGALDGRGTVAAVVGPAIGPCCYEVGGEVAAPYRVRFGAGVVRRGRLDLWTVAEQALRRAGVARVDRLELCTACRPDLFFSYRRDGVPRGGHGVIAFVD